MTFTSAFFGSPGIFGSGFFGVSFLVFLGFMKVIKYIQISPPIIEKSGRKAK
jgi:hypothetical protein